ncbi:MAG: response regulator [Proteobacteria bacterium]|nr:response regulator [Pseudomonadota bacterium]MBU1738495.1 response regulator [Pseudomonadota bacterium]
MATILLIDDDDVFRETLSEVLLMNGYEVIEAEDGRGAHLTCRNEDIDLVVTDILMPNQEGIETIIQIRRECPDMKIVAISGGGRNLPADYLYSAVRLGADMSFSKPLDPPRFLQALEGLLA